jgi:ATP-dependent DNA ligase
MPVRPAALAQPSWGILVAVHRAYSADKVVEPSRGLIGLAPIVFAKACELGLEGVVSKRKGSFNQSGRSRNWLQTKN